MAQFVRQPSPQWHVEVPGARWFRADLHVHTLDDQPGGRIGWSGGGGVGAEQATALYARELLQTAIARGVEVLGLTPHDIYLGDSPDVSALWAVVEAWNSEADDDGTPFRDKIYAVFPGFEPAMADGSRGVHLLFLFDPEIGREQFLRAFHAVMGGVRPWEGGQLQLAAQTTREAFSTLLNMRRDSAGAWDWLCIAPHAFSSDRGLFGQLKSQMLEHFPHEHLAALELADSHLPDEAHEGREPWLRDGMDRYHHAFIHASDACTLNPDPTSTALGELGSRTTFVKMASPRIEALRQAFLAADSRVRITFGRDGAGGLIPVAGPAPLAEDRPWLRSITVTGGTSFFGGQANGGSRSVEFRLNPDLTCIIGGRMSGKSTLLDGARIHFGFPPPEDPQVRSEVEGRARSRFLSGGPEVAEDICGPNAPTDPVPVRWPAIFFTQRELQHATRDQPGLRRLLYQLAPTQTAELDALERTIASKSADLRRLVRRIVLAQQALAEAQQRLASSEAAKAALERYEEIGAGRLTDLRADVARLQTFRQDLQALTAAIAPQLDDVAELFVPAPQTERMQQLLTEEFVRQLAAQLDNIRRTLGEGLAGLDTLTQRVSDLVQEGTIASEALRSELEQAVAEAGGTTEELNQFASLYGRAESFEGDRLDVERAARDHEVLRSEFAELRGQRTEAKTTHAAAMQRVADTVAARFEGNIRVRIVESGVVDELDEWVAGLRERGITRWWHDRQDRVFSSDEILGALGGGTLGQLGMSEQVAQTFRETMTDERRTELSALNTPDLYILELRLDDGGYRRMESLSGGQQVSLLLSLLLQSGDERPLVIDQPEEELDKAYLFSTVLPALRLLKGRRQVVFVTHDANIVVNGDADQVIYLQADANRGWVEAQGAIEQADVKQAVLTVLDGGEDAFEMRFRKYGF